VVRRSSHSSCLHMNWNLFFKRERKKRERNHFSLWVRSQVSKLNSQTWTNSVLSITSWRCLWKDWVQDVYESTEFVKYKQNGQSLGISQCRIFQVLTRSGGSHTTYVDLPDRIKICGTRLAGPCQFFAGSGKTARPSSHFWHVKWANFQWRRFSFLHTCCKVYDGPGHFLSSPLSGGRGNNGVSFSCFSVGWFHEATAGSLVEPSVEFQSGHGSKYLWYFTRTT